MRILLLSKEYPPHIYGGAGVHVAHLSRELSQLDNSRHIINVLCFGEQRVHDENVTVRGIQPGSDFPYRNLHHKKLIDTLLRNILMTGSFPEVDIIHCHTWYSHLAGCLIKGLCDLPLVITAHSLEPQRPWKEEQLGSAYNVSCWLEKTAFAHADGIIAVSKAIKTSIQKLYGIPGEKIHTIPNGIDMSVYKPKHKPEVLVSYGINPSEPFLLFVGRITKQKGIFHLLNAIKYLRNRIQIVFIATDPDTVVIEDELTLRIQESRSANRHKIIWINKFVPEEHIVAIYSHASVFVCPSIYEPFGIINLEAMACETPVIATATGGIREIVTNGQTGLLVPLKPKFKDDPEPKDPEQFSRDIASAVNSILSRPRKLRNMGVKARQQVKKKYSWTNIARQTFKVYRELLELKSAP
jgi:glycogen synthase